ncbi:hypothetical protein [Polynucleobacter sp. HIN5]|uniref:hypothetical protein n=1 Tax=Polynucleobacter sp. HIN5 TaxID=3047864 RepID=UPI0025747ED5|nr:hypothetical protein [Polynucleobacter sp. HIN5]BEI33974.1 hypothetical protein PHIN5_13420 [Polynucleobacter sp. HIN5]
MTFSTLIHQLPLIEISLITSIIFLHLIRATLNIGHGFISGLLLVSIASLVLLAPFAAIGAPWSLPFAAYIRGVTGDLSILSLLLIVLTWTGWNAFRITSITPILIAVVAILFYPFALGFTMFDPYAWGYHSSVFVGTVLLVAAIYFFAKHSWEALMLSIAVIAWSIHWHESMNLWDYLLDPFLAVWAIGLSIRWVIWGRPQAEDADGWGIDASLMARRKRGRMFD